MGPSTFTIKLHSLPGEGEDQCADPSIRPTHIASPAPPRLPRPHTSHRRGSLDTGGHVQSLHHHHSATSNSTACAASAHPPLRACSGAASHGRQRAAPSRAFPSSLSHLLHRHADLSTQRAAHEAALLERHPPLAGLRGAGTELASGLAVGAEKLLLRVQAVDEAEGSLGARVGEVRAELVWGVCQRTRYEYMGQCLRRVSGQWAPRCQL